MNRFSAPALLCVIALAAACGGPETEDESFAASDDALAASTAFDPLSATAFQKAEHAVARYAPNPAAIGLVGKVSRGNTTWKYTFRGDNRVWAEVSITANTARVVSHQVKNGWVDGPGSWDASQITVHPADLAALFPGRKISTMSLNDPIVMMRHPHWVVTFSAGGNATVDAITGAVTP